MRQITYYVFLLVAMFCINLHTFAQGVPQVSTSDNPIWYYIENGHNSDASGGTVINDNDGRYAFFITSKGENADVMHDALYPNLNRDSQKWRVEKTQDDTYYLINKAGGKLTLNSSKGTDDNTSRYIVSSTLSSEFKIAPVTSTTYTEVSGMYCTLTESTLAAGKYVVALNHGFDFAVSNSSSPGAIGVKNDVGLVNNPRAWRFVPAGEVEKTYPYIETKTEQTDKWYYLKNLKENKYVGIAGGKPVLVSDVASLTQDEKASYVFKVKQSDYIPANPGFFVNIMNAQGTYLGDGNASQSDWMLRHTFKPSERNETNELTAMRLYFRDSESERNAKVASTPFNAIKFDKNADAYESALAWTFEEADYTPPPVTEVPFSLINTTSLDRENEIVEVDMPAGVLYSSMALYDEDENAIPYQVLSGGAKIVFPATISAGATMNYVLKEGTPQAIAPKTYAAVMMPNSRADIAWENDRTAYRMYSRKLLTSDSNTANGVDLWVKKKSEPIVEKMYTYTNYHAEQDEGVDAYSVGGKTLGAGGIAACIGNTLYLHDPYDEYEIVCNGPLRSEFVLTYKNVIIDGDSYTKTVRITTDANGLLNKAVVRFDGKIKSMKLASGILLHTNADGVQFNEDNMIGYAEKPSEGTVTSSNPRMYVGVYMPGQTSTATINNQLVIMTDYAVGTDFTYYFGGGWNQFPKGEYSTDSDWFDALKKFKQKVDKPLTDGVISLPTKAEVITMGVKVNNRWISTHAAPGDNKWARSVYNMGNIDFYKVYQDPQYLKYAEKWAVSNNWGISGGTTTKDADNHTCGQTYIDLYMMDEVKDPKKIEAIKATIDNRIKDNPASDDWWWIDAMLMAMPTIARLGDVYNDTKYYDKMYALFANIRDKLVVNSSHSSMWPSNYRAQYGQGPILEGFEDYDGLYSTTDNFWWRDWGFQPNVPPKRDPNAKPEAWSADAPKLSPNGKNIYWARGNGWVIAAMVRTLQFIPENDAHRSEYIQMLKDMAAALKECQREDGFWNMNLADPNHYPAPETSGTALFTYGIAWGINNGFLDKDTYYPIVVKAWEGLCKTAVQSNGNMIYTQDVGEGPIDPERLSKTSVDFGVGAFLLATSEVVKLAPGEMPIPPEPSLSVEKVEAYSDTQLRIVFDDVLVQATALNKANYTIASLSIKDIEASGDKGVILTLNENLDYRKKYTLTLKNVQGESGSAVKEGEDVIFIPTIPVTAAGSNITVTAIESQTGNPPTNTIDGNLGTRWAQAGKTGQWIKYDLGGEFEIQAFDIAFYLGNQRVAYFDLEVSSDDKTFTPVLSNLKSSGITTEMERYPITPQKGRYARIVCNGNSAGGENWNSITEVRIRYKADDTGVYTPEAEQLISIYPNPLTDGCLNIVFNEPIDEDAEVSVLDMTGKKHFSGKYTVESNKITIDNLMLNTGVYILNVSVGTNKINKLFFVK
ncbi:DUF4861 domain-containing protein [Paludibacter sp. 221]|uniref:glycoside hydrolase family 88 protein n=1 Tax=Paludibacter sp. 221 TaxID=2302939 RepID=UPI0013D36D36|nr:glycoside hydrolase family 88 protein [Paludibacter sp. 221]NDV46622.1 DUF4861 domain-containing protein [Paludibacter sp. 221]